MALDLIISLPLWNTRNTSYNVDVILRATLLLLITKKNSFYWLSLLPNYNVCAINTLKNANFCQRFEQFLQPLYFYCNIELNLFKNKFMIFFIRSFALFSNIDIFLNVNGKTIILASLASSQIKLLIFVLKKIIFFLKFRTIYNKICSNF